MFQNITGHGRTKERLASMLSRPDITGTYLLYGPPSVGKRTVAFEAARTILCKDKKEEGCTCQSCRDFREGHPDFLCIGQHTKIKVSDVDLLLEFVSVSPLISDRKVAVIDNADEITWGASNRLLKTLEEPPDGFSFFLVTANPSTILPTILSRCVQYGFEALSQEDLINIIWKKMGFDLPKARILGWIGSDSSVDIFSKAGLYIKCREQALGFVMGMKDSVLSSLDYIDKVGKDNMAVFSDMVVLLLTDVLLLKNKIGEIINSDLRDDLTKLVGSVNEKALLGMVAVFSQVKKYSYLNINLGVAMKSAVIRTHPLLSAGT